jgi:hypothetical protein
LIVARFLFVYASAGGGSAEIFVVAVAVYADAVDNAGFAEFGIYTAATIRFAAASDAGTGLSCATDDGAAAFVDVGAGDDAELAGVAFAVNAGDDAWFDDVGIYMAPTIRFVSASNVGLFAGYAGAKFAKGAAGVMVVEVVANGDDGFAGVMATVGAVGTGAGVEANAGVDAGLVGDETNVGSDVVIRQRATVFELLSCEDGALEGVETVRDGGSGAAETRGRQLTIGLSVIAAAILVSLAYSYEG